MSATLSNFLQLSSIPCASQVAQESAGKCLNSVDGVCMRGGTKIAGTGGYELASMGYPSSTCAAAGIFTAGNQRYSLDGWKVVTNANVLKLERPLL